MNRQTYEKQNRENLVYFLKAFCILAGLIAGVYLLAGCVSLKEYRSGIASSYQAGKRDGLKACLEGKYWPESVK